MKKKVLFLLIIQSNALLRATQDESQALAKSLCGAGLILSAYACQKTLNYIIVRDTRTLNERITNMEAQPLITRRFAHHNNHEQTEISYLGYASKFMTSWLASAGLFLLYQAKVEANHN